MCKKRRASQEHSRVRRQGRAPSSIPSPTLAAEIAITSRLRTSATLSALPAHRRGGRGGCLESCSRGSEDVRGHVNHPWTRRRARTSGRTHASRTSAPARAASRATHQMSQAQTRSARVTKNGASTEYGRVTSLSVRTAVWNSAVTSTYGSGIKSNLRSKINVLRFYV